MAGWEEEARRSNVGIRAGEACPRSPRRARFRGYYYARHFADRSVTVPILGWSLAVFQHALWNSSLLVIGGMYGRDASVLKVVLIQGPIFTLPPLVALFVIARMYGDR